MSGNSRHQSPEADITSEDADRIVREILENDLPDIQISPSGELLSAISRYYRNRGNTSQGNDMPPAGSSDDGNSAGQRTFAALFESNMERIRRARLASTEGTLSPIPPSDIPISQERLSPGPSSRRSMPSSLTTGPSSEPRRARPRLTDSDRYMGRHRSLADRQALNSSNRSSNLTEDFEEFYAAGRQLQNASAQLRALLDTPITNFTQPSLVAEEYAGEAETNRAYKRRKLDTGVFEPTFTSKAYGHYGQVEPGKLNMEIDFCDGGMYSEEHGTIYAASNVLKNDSSVYCTKGNRCNLVLRHQGSTPFCLKELIIKAPPRGYTAPVQEGMVFVAMTSDELLTRTAQYQIQYSPPRGSRRRTSQRTPILSIRHSDGTVAAGRTTHIYGDDPEGDDDYRPAQIPTDFTDPEFTPPFRVTTSCSDDESDADRQQAASLIRRRRRAPNRIGSLRFEESSDSDDSVSDGNRSWREFHESYLLGNNSGESPARPSRRGLTRRSEPTHISVGLAGAIEAAQEATQEAVQAVGGGLMAPHARFFIERDKSKCTVRFDPPVSGRFILLKMWSPHHTPGGNIDIQSVVVKGFAGTRYFPSVQPR